MVVFSGQVEATAKTKGPIQGANGWGTSLISAVPRKLVQSVKWSSGVDNKAFAGDHPARLALAAAPKGPAFVSLPMEYRPAK